MLKSGWYDSPGCNVCHTTTWFWFFILFPAHREKGWQPPKHSSLCSAVSILSTEVAGLLESLPALSHSAWKNTHRCRENVELHKDTSQSPDFDITTSQTHFYPFSNSRWHNLLFSLGLEEMKRLFIVASVLLHSTAGRDFFSSFVCFRFSGSQVTHTHTHTRSCTHLVTVFDMGSTDTDGVGNCHSDETWLSCLGCVMNPSDKCWVSTWVRSPQDWACEWLNHLFSSRPIMPISASFANLVFMSVWGRKSISLSQFAKKRVKTTKTLSAQQPVEGRMLDSKTWKA